jgi:hypothetical protein
MLCGKTAVLDDGEERLLLENKKSRTSVFKL